MAAPRQDTAALSRSLIEEVRSGVFRNVYILMGDEPYYPDLVCEEIIRLCIDEDSRDFNQTVCYGADVNAEKIITGAREFPMFSERRLIVVKEAQMMKDIEALAQYCAAPLESTVLVLLLHKATVDKRKALYKTVQKTGAVLDSGALRDYEIPAWIQSHCASRGLQIAPAAAALLAEYAGTDLCTIAGQTEKILRSLPEGTKHISEDDVERNVGLSRQFSVFELTRELSMRNNAKAFRIAAHLGSSAKFAMPMAVSALYTHFSRILKYAALLASNPRPDPEQKARALQGVNPYFYKEYDTAVRNYPLPKAMAVISLLCEYDYLGKGGDGSGESAEEIFRELVAKILAL